MCICLIWKKCLKRISFSHQKHRMNAPPWQGDARVYPIMHWSPEKLNAKLIGLMCGGSRSLKYPLLNQAYLMKPRIEGALNWLWTSDNSFRTFSLRCIWNYYIYHWLNNIESISQLFVDITSYGKSWRKTCSSMFRIYCFHVRKK